MASAAPIPVMVTPTRSPASASTSFVHASSPLHAPLSSSPTSSTSPAASSPAATAASPPFSSVFSTSIALTVGTRPPHSLSSSSARSPLSAPQHHQHHHHPQHSTSHQQHGIHAQYLLRAQPSSPRNSVPLSSLSATSAAASLSGPSSAFSAASTDPNLAPPAAVSGSVPFFVASGSSLTASRGTLTASAGSAFRLPSTASASSAAHQSAAAHSSSSAAAAPAPGVNASPTSSLGQTVNSSTAKRIVFCSFSPSAVASSPSSYSSPAARAAVSSEDWHRLLSSSAARVNKRSVSDMVLRWLVQEGYADVADRFEAEALLKADRPSAHIEERTAIRKLILSGDVATAVSRCNALYPAMLDQPQHAALSFMAQQQTLIELIREQQLDKALSFARQEMAPRAQHHPALMLELEKTMSLLAFPQPATQSPYGTLLSQQRRHSVSSAFNAALLQQQQQTVHPQPSSALHSPLAVSTTMSSIQPAASDLVRLIHRLQCLQPQLASTHLYPTVSISCKPSVAVTASSASSMTSDAAMNGGAHDGGSSVSRRSNSVVLSASPSHSSPLLSPVATRTPVTMPMPSRSVAGLPLPSPFLLSSSTRQSVPPSPVSLSPSAASFSPSHLPSSLPTSSATSRRSSLSVSQLHATASVSSSSSPSSTSPLPSAFALPSQAHPSAARVVARGTVSISSSTSSSGVGGGNRGGISSSSISSISSSGSRHAPIVQRGQQPPRRAAADDEDSDMT